MLLEAKTFSGNDDFIAFFVYCAEDIIVKNLFDSHIPVPSLPIRQKNKPPPHSNPLYTIDLALYRVGYARLTGNIPTIPFTLYK